MPIRSRASYRALLAAAILGPTLLFAAMAWWSWHRVNLETSASIARTVDVLYEHVAKVLQSDRLILEWIDDDVRGMDGPALQRNEPHLHALLKEIVGSAEEVDAAFVTDADGELQAMSRGFPVPAREHPAPTAVNVGDRAYFREAQRDAGVIIDGPFRGRVSGKPIFNVVQRLAAPDGRFRGVAALVVSPTYFSAFWREIAAPGDTVSLVREDGIVLARYPEAARAGDQPLRFSVSTMTRMRATGSGQLTAPPSLIDGVVRVIGYRKLRAYPLYVAYAIDKRNIVREWYPTLAAFGSVAAAAAASLLLTALIVIRRARGEAEALGLAESTAAALRASEARYRGLYEQTPAPMHALAADGTVVAVSDSWLELLGYTRDEVVGQPLTAFQAPATAALFAETAWPRFLELGVIRNVEARYRRRSGELVDVLVSARVERDEHGRFLHALGVLVDLTEQRRTEAALLQAQKMEVLGQMTGGVAHDFNNLLTAVIGTVDIARTRVRDGGIRRLLSSALSAAESAVALTQRLLAFARKQHLEPQPVDLRQLVESMEELLARSLGPAVELAVEAEAGLWPALVDRNQIELVILNLAINARDAMPNGGALTIALSNRRADATAPARLAAGEYVRVVVTDTGTGMDEVTLARAIEPFYTTKEAGKGTGLGLAMVHGILTQSGGALRITSRLGEGTSVEAWLPRSAEAALAAPAAAAASEARGSGTILVCEDIPAVRDFVVEVLEEAGYQAIATAAGAAALAVLEAETPVDLLLVDFAMPGMNGGVVARVARERRPDLPVLLVTGNFDTAALAREANGLPILRKPFGRAQLLAQLNHLLQHGRAA